MADVVTLFFRVVADTRGARAELTSLGRTVDSLGRSFQQLGTTLTVGVTAPLLALGAAAAKSAINIDQQVNLLKAFTGSAEAAEKRLAQLIATAQKTPGLTVNLAAMLDAQARVAGVAESSINRLLPVIGRLNAVSTLGDPQRFVQNLVQIVTQNFERADLKELVGQSPIAGELIKTLFNVDSPINSEAIRSSAERLGIRTADGFFIALANAAANNPKLAAVTDSIGSQIEKMVDRVSIALRPLGLAIIQSITPIVEALVPIVEKLGQVFASLPKPIQTTVIVLGAIAAAIGPLILLAGALAQSIVALTGAMAAFQAAGLLTAEASVLLSVAFGPVGIAIAAIVAALGVGIVAWSQYEDATERAEKVTTQNIVAQQQQVEQLTSVQKQAEALANSQGTSAEKHTELQKIIAQLDPDTRAYIQTISDENVAIAELNRVLKDQITLKQGGLSENLADIGSAANELQARNEALARQDALLKNIADTLARTNDERALQEVSTDFFGQPIQNAKELGNAINRLKAELDGGREALVSFGERVQAFITRNKLTVEAFTQQQLALGRTRGEVDGMLLALNAFQKKQADVAAQAKSTTSFIDEQRQAFDKLIESLDRANKKANDQVDKQIRQIALTSKNAAEAKARVQEALKLDDDFFFAVQERQRVAENVAAGERVIDPKRPSAGKIASEQRAVASAQLKLLQQIEQERDIATRRESEALRRSFEQRLIGVKDFTDRSIALERTLLAAKLAVLKEEEAVAERTAKNRTEAEAKRGEIRLKAQQAQLATDLRIADLEQQRRTAGIRAEQDHQQRLAEIREISRRGTEQAVRDALAAGGINAREAEERLVELERQRFEERKQRLQEQFVLARGVIEEEKRINGELAVLAAQRAEFEIEAARRITQAQADAVRALRAFLQERRKIIEETAQTQVELIKQEAEFARIRAEQTGSPQAKLAAIRAELAAEEAAAVLRNKLNLARIEDDRANAIAAAENNAGLIEQAQKASNERKLAEEQRFQNELKRIRNEATQEEAALDPTSNQSLFGVSDESLSKLSAAGQMVVNVLTQIGASGRNMGQILSEAFGKVITGAGSLLKTLILTGETGPAAFKKLIASIIADIAAESLVNALKETAAGFAALARGDGVGAAFHFKSAALWGAAAAAAGGVGAALSGGRSGASGGSGASQSAGAFGQDQRDLRVTRGGAGGPGEEVSEGNPLFVTLAKLTSTVDKLDKRIEAFPPEHVLMIGASRRPDVIAEAAVKETRRDSDFTRQLGTALGVT